MSGEPIALRGVQGIKQEWRANWRTGVAALIAIGLSFGAFQGLSSLFVIPLQQAFGWSRGEIAFSYNAALLTAASSPFLGRAIDRLGTRKIMLWGMVITALAYTGLACMNGSLPLFYVLCVVASVTGLSASGLTCSRVVSQVFIVSRGFSLAVARSGLALASALLPTVLFAIMARYGWRAGYLMQALLVFLVALPAVYFWIGRTAAKPLAKHQRPPSELPALGQLLSDKRLWFLCLGAGLGYAPATALMSQLQPILMGKGLSASSAATLVGMAGASSFVGALVTGSLVDRYWAPAIALIFACGSAAGATLLALNGTLDPPMAAAAIALIGLGLGAEIDIVAFMVARYFGVRSFSTVYGFAIFAIAFSGAIGASSLGIAYDRFGNYDLALLVIAGAFVLAGLLYLMLGRYPDDEVA